MGRWRSLSAESDTNHRQFAFLSRRGLVQPLQRDRHGGVVAHEAPSNRKGISVL
jgi:hypothetical protein